MQENKIVSVESIDIENAVNNGVFADNAVGLAIQRQHPDCTDIDLTGIEFEDGSIYTLTQDGYDWVMDWFMNGAESVEPIVITLH